MTTQFPNGLVLLPDAARPKAIRVHELGYSGYTRLEVDDDGIVVGTLEERLEMIGHVPCNWSHPSWHDELTSRLDEHLKSCEMR